MSPALKFGSLHIHRFVQEQIDAALRPSRFSFDLVRGVWTRSIDDGVEHFISIPTDIAGEDGPVVVTANLGVHYRPLAALLAERYSRQRAQNLSLFTRNLGQLSARRAWREWIIRQQADAERVVRRLASRIVVVGLPWLARFDTLAAVCEGFRAFGHQEHRRDAVPILEQLVAADSRSADLPTGGSASVAPPTTAIKIGQSKVLSVHIDRDEIAWHCDE